MRAAQITAVLLAGGKSERFWPLGHKLQLSFLGKTLLEHQVAQLVRCGFKKIIVVVGQDLQFLPSFPNGVQVVVQKGVGQSGAIISAAHLIENSPTLILNADDVVDDRLFSAIVEAAQSATPLLVGYKVSSYFPGGYFVMKGKKIAQIVEKPGEGKEPSSFVRLVCDFFPDPTIIVSQLKNTTSAQDDVYEIALSKLMQSGCEFEMVEYEGRWIPLKYPWSTLALSEFFLSQLSKPKIAKSARIHKTATIEGAVWIDENVRVLEYAKISGPSYIGAGSIVGNHTLIRAAHIGSKSVIGFTSDITRSYLGSEVWLHSNYVGDSVLANGVTMGAGTTLANLRLDEGVISSVVKNIRISTHRTKLGALIGEGVHIGVGAYIMPGIKIGAHASIGAGVILQEDVDANMRCYVTQKQTRTLQKQLSTDRSQFHKKI